MDCAVRSDDNRLSTGIDGNVLEIGTVRDGNGKCEVMPDAASALEKLSAQTTGKHSLANATYASQFAATLRIHDLMLLPRSFDRRSGERWVATTNSVDHATGTQHEQRAGGPRKAQRADDIVIEVDLDPAVLQHQQHARRVDVGILVVLRSKG